MTAARVTRTEGFEAYTVRSGLEWATILIRGWQAKGNDDQPREIGEILIYSSFGAWAHQWSHLGMPFKQWLPNAERSYVATKFMGDRAYKFDGELTVRELRQSLLDGRREGDITKNDARTIWDWIEESQLMLESSGRDFVQALYDCDREADWQDAPQGRPSWDTGPGRGARFFLEQPWERIRNSIDPQFAGFWRELWPAFVEHLKAETASKTTTNQEVL